MSGMSESIAGTLGTPAPELYHKGSVSLATITLNTKYIQVGESKENHMQSISICTNNLRKQGDLQRGEAGLNDGLVGE